MTRIKIQDAVKYYRGTPGQQLAWSYLEKVLSDEHREQFQDLYRSTPQEPQEPKAPVFLYAAVTNRFDGYGLRVMTLTLMNGTQLVDQVTICSGQSYAQELVHPTEDYSGSMRICPEGVYNLGKIDDIGYNPGVNDGFGRYVIPVTQRDAPGSSKPPNNRSALLIHADNNRPVSPGSAGCLCPFNSHDMGKIVSWMRSQAKPEYLIVDLGKGYVQNFTGVYLPKK